MRKIKAGDPESRSADVVADSLERLKALFPEAFADGRIDFEVLKQLLGGTVDDSGERYGLNWHGKRRALWNALMPSTGTLRPCPQESVDWETTRNVVIEGDNLEVLKLLQKSYAGKVKLIYIDPPYNTGNDFVYPDDWRDGVGNYLALTGQADGERRKLSSNPETSGRFHTDWLNMMYPRLKLARSLLRADGVIMISIDDGEVAHIRMVGDEIFGSENFIAEIVWEGANKNDARQIGICHDYVLCYGKDRDELQRDWSIGKEGIKPVLDQIDRLREEYGDNYTAISEVLSNWFRAMKATPSFGLRRFRKIDSNGAYKEDDPTAPGGRRFDLRDPRTDAIIPLRPNRGWAFDQQEFNRLVTENRISFINETSIMVKRYLHETNKVTPPSVFYQPARSASERLAKLMESNIFHFPKDETILEKFVEMATESNDGECIVMDFFAGSGTTGHAVMEQNAADGGQRRYILVQLPEPLDPANREQKTAADFCDRLGKSRNIAELTKERLRRAAGKVRNDHPAFAGDLGFRVLKLDSSNIRAWDPDPDDLEGSLLAIVNRVKEDRSDDDVFHEILLKFGYDLSAPVETRTIAGKCVRSVGDGLLIVCLDETLGHNSWETLAEGIAQWHVDMGAQREATAIFRDNAFGNDVVKLNVVAILEQSGLTRVYSL